MTIKIIIARYREEIDWIKYPDSIIYNKGPPLTTTHPVIELPNIGREGHTYLTHIINNYDRLDDYTIFLQGNPFEHNRTLGPRIEALFQRIRSGESLKYENLTDWFLDSNISGCPHHKNLPLIECYEKIFGVALKEKAFKFGAGAQFLVSRETIRRRSVDFYKKILRLLDYAVSPIEGYAVERFWYMIFTDSLNEVR
jgi:hypothetical protein